MSTDKGGRPKKHELEVRSEEIKLRYTLLEVEHLQQQADACHLPRATYIRKRSLGERITLPKVNRIDPALIVKLDQLMKEVNAIGVNYNQMVFATNRKGVIPDGFEAIPEILQSLRQKLETTLDQLVASDGS